MTPRHIPDEELHAYLDQALSRSQCIEIERHLAECGECRAARDASAALRDRVTSLLSRVGPPIRTAPSFSSLASRSEVYAASRARRRQGVLWAASLAGALATGFISHQLFMDRDQSTVVASAALKVPTAGPAAPVPTVEAAAPKAVVTSKPRETLASNVTTRSRRVDRSTRSLGYAQTPVLGSGEPPEELIQDIRSFDGVGVRTFGGNGAGYASSMTVDGLDRGASAHVIASDISGFNAAPPVEQPYFTGRSSIADDSVRATIRRLNRLIH